MQEYNSTRRQNFFFLNKEENKNMRLEECRELYQSTRVNEKREQVQEYKRAKVNKYKSTSIQEYTCTRVQACKSARVQ